MSDSREATRQLLGAASSAAASVQQILEAEVYDVDPVRKTVQVKWLDDKQTSQWLRVAFALYEDDHSFAGAMPKVESTVLVACPSSNRDAGIVIGSLSDPEQDGTDITNIEYMIKTKNNDIIKLKGAAGIEIISSGTVNVTSNDVRLGSGALFQLVVKYDLLKAELTALQTVLNTHIHGTGVGPSSTMLPQVAFTHSYQAEDVYAN